MDRYEKELQEAKDNGDLTLIEFSDMRFAKRIKKTMAELLKTDIMAEYYTPDISEFHVGFDIEANVENVWCKISYMKNYLEGDGYPTILDTHVQLQKGDIRVKHLDHEDIIEFEWVSDGDGFFHLGNYGLLFQDSRVWIWLKRYKSGGVRDDKTIFCGTIRNKNELRRVLKQVGVIQ